MKKLLVLALLLCLSASAQNSHYPPNTGGGGGVTTLNGESGDVTLVGGTGISITPAGQNITITNTGSSPVGTPNTFAGFDNSGALFSTPWGIDSNGQATGNFTGTLPSDQATSLQIFPSVSTSLTGGYEGIVVGPNLSSSMNFMSAFNAETVFASGFSNPQGTQTYMDQSNVGSGATLNNYTSYGSFPIINGPISNTVRGFISSASIGAVALGSYGSLSDTATFGSGGSITGDYQGVNLTPNFNTGFTLRSFTGLDVNPTFNDAVTDDAHGETIFMQNMSANNITGISISMQNAVSTGGATNGLTIDMLGSTDTNPQGTTAIQANARTNINAPTNLVSAQTFQIGNRFESELIVPLGSPVTGTDSLGNDMAGDLDAQDSVADGVTGGIVGWSGVGFISELLVGSGKTVDTANIFLAAASLPSPASPETDGGIITNLSMIKTAPPLNQGGALTVANIKAVNIAGSFSGAAVNSWGIYEDDTLLHNHFAGLVDMGFLQLNGSTSGVISSRAAATTTNYTVTWPAAQGTGALTNDGSGNLSWASSSGANTTLSNLTSPTAINQNLTFGAGAGPRLISTPDTTGSTSAAELTVAGGNASGSGNGGAVLIRTGTSGSGNPGQLQLSSDNGIVLLPNAVHSPPLLEFFEGTENFNVSLRASGALSANLALVLPVIDGTSGQALVTDGSGNLSFGTTVKANSFVLNDGTNDLFTIAEVPSNITLVVQDIAAADDFEIAGGTTQDGSNGGPFAFAANGAGATGGNAGDLLFENADAASASGTGGNIVSAIAAPSGGNTNWGEIGLSGHISIGPPGEFFGNPASVTPQSGLGTGATTSVSANSTDSAGVITLNAGTVGLATGAQVTVTFQQPYNSGDTPIIELTPVNATAGLNAPHYYVTSTNTGFTINFATASVLSLTYVYNYTVLGLQ